MIEAKAQLMSITQDYRSKKVILSFEVDDYRPDAYEVLKGKMLRLSAKAWKERRSLDANAYMWVLFQKMALLQDTTAQEIHDMMLFRYPVYDIDEDGGYVIITVSSKVDMSRIDGYWMLCSTSKDGAWNAYRRIKGTSELNTTEMSWFIHRIVEEAQEMGLETATPEELERMAALCERRAG